MTAPATMPLVIEWPKPGEIVDVSRSKDFTDLVMLMRGCPPPLAHSYFCENCKTALRNQFQLEMHLEKATGTHRIVAFCDRRRVYEAATPVSLPEIG